MSWGNHSFNLKRHIRRFHADTYRNGLDSKARPIATQQKTPAHLFALQKVSIPITVDILRMDIISMVARSGLSLKTLSGSSFKNTPGEIASSLGVSLQRDSVRQLIVNEAQQRMNRLKKTLRTRLVLVKVDWCARHNRSFLAVHVQFSVHSAVHVWTLDFREYLGMHAAESLKNVIEQVLRRYGIKELQVLAVVWDSAVDTANTAELLSESESDVEEADKKCFRKKTTKVASLDRGFFKATSEARWTSPSAMV